MNLFPIDISASFGLNCCKSTWPLAKILLFLYDNNRL